MNLKRQKLFRIKAALICSSLFLINVKTIITCRKVPSSVSSVILGTISYRDDCFRRVRGISRQQLTRLIFDDSVWDTNLHARSLYSLYKHRSSSSYLFHLVQHRYTPIQSDQPVLILLKRAVAASPYPTGREQEESSVEVSNPIHCSR